MALKGGDMIAVMMTTPNPEAIIVEASAYWPMRENDGEKVRINTMNNMGQAMAYRMNQSAWTDWEPTVKSKIPKNMYKPIPETR